MAAGVVGFTTLKVLDDREKNEIYELYALRNPAHPLQESDKTLLDRSLGLLAHADKKVSKNQQADILKTQENNMPFLFMFTAFIQKDPKAFVGQYRVTDEGWKERLISQYK